MPTRRKEHNLSGGGHVGDARKPTLIPGWWAAWCGSWLILGGEWSTWAQSADVIWTPLEQIGQARGGQEPWIQPAAFQGVRLNAAGLREVLAGVASEGFGADIVDGREVPLPLPDGRLARFRFVESPVMAPELAARYPEIKTYVGVGLDDPAATVRFDLTPAGFHAQILSPGGAVYIDPLWRGNAVDYASYSRGDLASESDDWRCYVDAMANQPLPTGWFQGAARPVAGTELRTFRLAVAATGEYTAFHGGTVSAGLAAIVTAINRVNGVYENEVAVRLVLVGNNDQVVYTDPGTDPYSNSNPNALLLQNQATLDSVIGSANYDIGHVFGTGGGGLAMLGCVCLEGLKAQGETGSSSPVGDPFYIDYVAHEIGHQFGADHTFNGTQSSCAGLNRNASTAYEPGSGSTIMAYAGICEGDDLQLHTDPWFHFASQAEILSFVDSISCGEVASTGNHVPTVDAGLDYVIPKATPFTLTAVGSDADGDPITFCWEESDLGPAQPLSANDNGSSPLFRSFPPTTSPARVFPKLSALLDGTVSWGEKLPMLGRTMRFCVTARDNRAGGGGVAIDDVVLTVDGNSGPFEVTAPTTAVAWWGTQTVTWAVAGTANAPVNAATVTILLSTDGGNTFPTVLVASTPNDGSETVTFPAVDSTAARVKVQADNNIFFDLSDEDFTITPPPDYLITTGANALVVTVATPGDHALQLMEPAAGEIVFAAAGRTFSIDGNAPRSDDSDSLSLTGVATITVQGGAGADTFEIQGFAGLLPSLVIRGGAGNDTVRFEGDVAWMAGADLAVDLEDGDPVLRGDSAIVEAGTALRVAGGGTITIECREAIVLEAGAHLESAEGDIGLSSDRMEIEGGTIVTEASGRVLLRPATPGWLTDLGTTLDTAANTLGLSAAELGQVTTGSLRIGDVDAGGILVTQTLSLANVVSLDLVSGGTIADAVAGGVDVAVDVLTVEGELAPGASPGQFRVDGAVTLTSGSRFKVEIGGVEAGVAYDQLSVTGRVDIEEGVILEALAWTGYSPSAGSLFTLIDREGGSGTFVGLPEGSTVNVGGTDLRISYSGGDGDDVTLRAPPPTAAGLAYFWAALHEDGNVELVWSTQVEVQTLGYRIERAMSDGRWARVTPEMIPARGTDLKPQRYGLTDAPAAPARQTRYRLVEVDLRGVETVLAEIGVDPVVALTLTVARTVGGVGLEIRGAPNLPVTVESATALAGVWSQAAQVTLDEAGVARVALVANGAGETRFYRVSAESWGGEMAVSR